MIANSQKISLSSKTEVLSYREQDDAIIVRAIMCRTGNWTDGSGTEVTITEEMLAKLIENYNREVQQEYQKIKANKKDSIGKIVLEKLLGKKQSSFTINDITLLPICQEHDVNQDKVVGRVIGLLELVRNGDAFEMHGNLFISTKKNVEQVTGGLFNQVSISFYPEIHKMEEISFTVYGAVEGSQIIKMSKFGIKPNSKILSRSIQECNLKLSKIDEEIKQIDTQLLKLKREQIVDKQVFGLVALGKVYPRDKKMLKEKLFSMSSDFDRDVLLSVIKSLPNAIDFRVYNKNRNAFKMEELLMSKEINKVTSSAEEIAKEVANILKNDKTLLEPQENVSLKKAENTTEEEAHFTREHAKDLVSKLNEGKFDEVRDYLCKFAEDSEETAVQEAMSKPQEQQEEEAKLNKEREGKEEFKRSITSTISELMKLL